MFRTYFTLSERIYLRLSRVDEVQALRTSSRAWAFLVTYEDLLCETKQCQINENLQWCNIPVVVGEISVRSEAGAATFANEGPQSGMRAFVNLQIGHSIVGLFASGLLTTVATDADVSVIVMSIESGNT